MTRDDILALLISSDGFVSGEAVSVHLGISRAAVSQAVRSLRADGYGIDAVTNRGYRLLTEPDLLSEGAIRGHFLRLHASETTAEKHIHVYPSLPSTNRTLRDLAEDGAPSGTAVFAEEQTAGRGRLGRAFYSPSGTGLYFSYLLRPDVSPEEALPVTAWTAVAVQRALEKAAGISLSVKWVNDLIFGHKKIGGILTEMSVESESGRIRFITIGLNIYPPEGGFPEGLNSVAAALYPEAHASAMSALYPEAPAAAGPVLHQEASAAAGPGLRQEATAEAGTVPHAESPSPVSRARIAAALLTEMDRLAEDFPSQKDQYLAAYRRLCLTPGRPVLVGDEKEPCLAEGIEDDFALRVRAADGSLRLLRGGDVHMPGFCGWPE